MGEKTETFRIMHGLVKGAIKNIISLVHGRLPKEYKITNGYNKPRQPEIANLCNAFDAAMIKSHIKNAETSELADDGSPKMIIQAKEAGLGVLCTDSVYYLMAEHFLREYVHLKMDHAFGHEAVEKAWFDQWNSKSQELLAMRDLAKVNKESNQGDN